MKAIDKLLEIGFTKTLDNHNEVIWKLDDENGKETLSFGVIKGVKAVFIKGGFSLELGYIILNYIKELEKEKEKENAKI